VGTSRSRALLAAASALAATIGTRAAASPQSPPTTPVTRAVAYLAREVPAWHRNHSCYSCHNNGDAARALMAALNRNHDVREALADTLAWLAAPRRWATNRGGEGGGDDKRLARIQFANAATAGALRSLVPRESVRAAAEIVAADQQADGSWRLDSSDSLGSPATYGTVLATALARQTIASSGMESLKGSVARADRWLQTIEPHNVPDAAALILSFQDATPASAAAERRSAALEFLKRGQAPSGGWGPYLTSPPEAFDTALAMLALSGSASRTTWAPVFTRDGLDYAINRGRAFLIREQLADGSWVETTRPSGQTSYAQRISTTAWALMALLETDERPAYGPDRRR
jgi:hypothetical protein